MLITPKPVVDPMVALYRPIAAATPKMSIHSSLVCLPAAGKAPVERRSTSTNAHNSMIIAATESAQKKYSSGNKAFIVRTYLDGPCAQCFGCSVLQLLTVLRLLTGVQVGPGVDLGLGGRLGFGLKFGVGPDVRFLVGDRFHLSVRDLMRVLVAGR